MKIKNSIFFSVLVLFLILGISSCAFAEEPAMPQIDNGTVSGGADLVTVNPWKVDDIYPNGNLTYEIPEGVTEVKTAKVIVNVYSGSGAPTYALHSNTTLITKNGNVSLGYEDLAFDQPTVNDPTVYVINNHTTKVYSDYQMIYDIKDKITTLNSGDNITINVETTPFENKSFDGRIKLIALIFVYNDGDKDNITYWLNVGQSWTQATRSNLIYTENYTGNKDKVYFDIISLSSYDAACKLNGKILFEPIVHDMKDYYIHNIWDVTDIFQVGNNTNFTYTSSTSGWGSYKSNIQLLKILNKEPVNIYSKIETEYKNTVYAGVVNNLTVNVFNGNKTLKNVNVKVFEGSRLIGSRLIKKLEANESYNFSIVDTKIRPITKNTANGENNTIINYKVLIEDEDDVFLNSTDVNYNLLYNGYLGKNFEYPTTNGSITRVYTITGDLIILNKDDSTYLKGSDTNRSDIWNINLKDDLMEALLYISYNWDKTVGFDYPQWNTTFNNKIVTPIAYYRDQSNLGTYGKYGYGLIVYNLTSLLKNGENIFNLNKIKGMTAVYPSSLLILTNSKNISETKKTVYIAEEADLLSKSYNKNLETGAYTKFNVDTRKMINSTLYVFAASPQNNEGNIIFNGLTYENVWNGSSNSVDYFTINIFNKTINKNVVYFQANGSTILSLHQILVVETKVNETKLIGNNITMYYKNGTRFEITLTDSNNKPLANETVIITIIGRDMIRTTDKNGKASIAINLIPGIYPVKTTFNGTEEYQAKSINNTIKVLSTISGENIIKTFKNGTQYFAKFIDGQGKPLVKKEVEFNIYGVFYKRFTDNNGIARLNVNLRPGEYIITGENPLNGEKKSNNITVLSSIEGKDIVKYFKNGTQYYAKFFGSDRKPLVKTDVTFNIYGVFYTRTTNEEGIAKLNINLRPGKYIITAINPKTTEMYSNNITVLPKLTGNDLTMFYKDGSSYKAKLVDDLGKPVKNVALKFNIYGVFYQRITDDEGVARLNINLMPGQYIVTTSYGDSQISNIVTVKSK